MTTTFAAGGTINVAIDDVLLTGGTLQIQAGASIVAAPTNRTTAGDPYAGSKSTPTPGVTASPGTTVNLANGSTRGDTLRQDFAGELWGFEGGPGISIDGTPINNVIDLGVNGGSPLSAGATEIVFSH